MTLRCPGPAALGALALSAVLTSCAERPEPTSLQDRATDPSVTGTASAPSAATSGTAVTAAPALTPAGSPTTPVPSPSRTGMTEDATVAASPRTVAATTAAPRSSPSRRPGGGGTSAPAVTATPRPTSSPTTPSAGTTARALTIRDFAFSPRLLTVAVGTSVRATNEDEATHDWTSDTGVWRSGDLDTGASFAFTFRTAGTFDYLCERHPQMTGTVTVTPG